MRPDFNPVKIKLIVGLGNPDREHENTYHNVGAIFVEFIKHRSLVISHKSLVSNSYMNSSGGFVKGAAKKKGAKPREILVAHDDSDLNLGTYKIDFGRGSAGHKGVESVVKSLGTKDFWRLRIGIRSETRRTKAGLPRQVKAGDFVLNKISPKNKKNLEKVFEEAAIFLIIND